MVKIAVNGAMGRMGNRILSLAARSQDFKIVAAFEHAGHRSLGKDLGALLGLGEDLKVKLSECSAKHLKSCDVLIDFSSSQGTHGALRAAQAAKTRLVIGTTGLDADAQKAIQAASRSVAVLYSPNMSIGANFLFELARLAAQRLKEGYDIEIIEAHHRLKKDAPSGTAKHLAEVIAEEKGWDLKKAAKYGRQGLTGERSKDEIGIHVVRAGDIVGDHRVLFSGPGETVELSHHAQSRDAFARGALVAALFVSKKKAGLFNMFDVLR